MDTALHSAANTPQFYFMRLKALPRLVLLFIGLLLLIGLLSFGSAVYLLAEPSYTIYDEKDAITVSGRFQTVADVLDAATISLRPEDQISPELDKAADPKKPIQIERANPVTIRSENGTLTVWTHQEDLAAFLAEAGIRLQPDQQLLIDQEPVAKESLTGQRVPPTIDIAARVITVVIDEAGKQRLFETRAATVAAVLQDAGIILEEEDRVDPAPGTQVQDGATIQIARAIPLTIQVDGEVQHLKSHFKEPLQVLQEAGVLLGESDYMSPPAGTELQAGARIEVVRVSNEYRFEDEAIPFQTVYQPSDELDLDSKAVLSQGSPGKKRRRFRLLFENGVQVGEELEEEWVEVEPVNQVIGYGTKINTGTVDTPEGPREYWRVVRMRATAYTAASAGKSPDHPSYGITASGLPAGTGVVAIDPNVVPFRSEVYVPGYGIGFAGDTGGGVKGRWIDLGYDEEELQTWNGYVDVYYLTPVPEDINYLLPEVLP